MENDDIFEKLNFCYLVGYPHLKLASAPSEKISHILQIMCKNIGNFENITAKLLLPKFSASKQ